MATYWSTYNLSVRSVATHKYKLLMGDLKPIKMEDRNDLIEHYFNLGFQQKELLSYILLIYGQNLSSRQLRRILSRRGLRIRKHVSNLSTVIHRKAERELQSSGLNIGYRSMLQKLLIDHDLVVAKETVRHALRILDPEGVDAGLRHRLQRRQYKGRGANFLWHGGTWTVLIS